MSDSKKPTMSEIRAHQGERFGGIGTIVTNCIQHMNLPCESRPFECKLCQTDTRNDLSRAVAINQWLNEQIDTARTDIPYLLDLVKRMGEALGRFSSEFPVPGCGYCTITIEPDGKVTHETSCPIPEARELLKEIDK